MERQITNKEQEILKNVIKEELDFITYIDVNTGICHVIVTNPSAEVIPPDGYDYETVNRRSIPVFVHPEDRENCEQKLTLSYVREELSKKPYMTVVYRLLCKDCYRYKELHLSYHEADQNTVVIVRRDITDSLLESQRQKEALQNALCEARRSNEEKNELLERISHEIRIPMNSILGLSHLASEHARDHRLVQENLAKLDASARFLLLLFDDILNLSQLESGKTVWSGEAGWLDDFFEELCQAVAGEAKNKDVGFSVDKRGDFRVSCVFDQKKVYRAIFNILDNAVKFTQPEGCVTFVAEKLRESETEVLLRLEVRDNGRGMDDKFLPHMFEPFAQEDEGSTTLNGGSGLGLAISKCIIEGMGGQIDAYSKKGQGTTLIVSFALKREKITFSGGKEEVYEETEYDFSGKRALLAEDNEINIEITRNLLGYKKLTLEVARNGKECVELYLRNPPDYYDIVLMDIRMPVMDGLEAAEKIRRSGREDSLKIPIVAMTANVFEADVKKSQEVGMDAYLTKPLEVGEMYRILDRLLRGHLSKNVEK